MGNNKSENHRSKTRVSSLTGKMLVCLYIIAMLIGAYQATVTDMGLKGRVIIWVILSFIGGGALGCQLGVY
jgi:hypothetical protein